MKITDVKYHRLRYPVTEKFGNSFTWITERSSILVEILTDAGITGWGQGAGSRKWGQGVVGEGRLVSETRLALTKVQVSGSRSQMAWYWATSMSSVRLAHPLAPEWEVTHSFSATAETLTR